MQNVTSLPLKNKLCYGMGSLGYSSLSQTMHSFIMFFATSVMGISGSLVGIAIAIATLWDGISDPLVGNLSDRCKSRFFGKRLGFIFFAIFAIAFCNILLWGMPKGGQGFMFCWLLVFLLLQETANTFFGTPNTALGIDIAKDYDEQSKIQSFRTVFNIIGMILPSLLLFFLMPTSTIVGQNDYTQSGFLTIAMINSILMIAFGLVTVFGNLKKVQSLPLSTKKMPKFSFSQMMKDYVNVFKKPTFAIIILGYAFSQIASIFLTSVGMHLFTYAYHFSSSQISILLLVLFFGAILSQPFWLKTAKKIDKKATVISALTSLVFGVGAVLITFLFRDYVDISTIYILTCIGIFVCGFGTGALYCLPISMFADVVCLEEYHTKEDKTGAYLGCYSFTYNMSNAISLLVIGVLLDVIKFDSNQPLQAMSVQSGLGWIVFCGCGISLAISILIFSRYKLKRSDILKVQLKLKNSKKD